LSRPARLLSRWGRKMFDPDSDPDSDPDPDFYVYSQRQRCARALNEEPGARTAPSAI